MFTMLYCAESCSSRFAISLGAHGVTSKFAVILFAKAHACQLLLKTPTLLAMVTANAVLVHLQSSACISTISPSFVFDTFSTGAAVHTSCVCISNLHIVSFPGLPRAPELLQ